MNRSKPLALRCVAALLAVCLALLAPPAFAQKLPNEAGIRAALDAVVGVQAIVPREARTANSLGTLRQGSGVVIDDEGLVLTIGYLILEADYVNVVLQEGGVVEAEIVGYDHATGFGLVRATEPLSGSTVATLGSSSAMASGDGGITAALGGPRPVMPVEIVSRRSFAGYWEYLLPNAIFTTPPQPMFGGAPLFDFEGKLIGIGSLIVNDAAGPERELQGNMFVPIDALAPIMESMLTRGRGPGPGNPWLGFHAGQSGNRVYVERVEPNGPADDAGLQQGDVILGVAGRHISTLEDLFSKIWASGPPGSSVTLEVLPKTAFGTTLEIKQVKVQSSDRYKWLRLRD